MRVGVLGSGMVGEAIGARLLEIGHEVRMGSRTADGPALQWARPPAMAQAPATSRNFAIFAPVSRQFFPGSGGFQRSRAVSRSAPVAAQAPHQSPAKRRNPAL
jgi:8-hydroxy-5-deazaflavin:NADPH oxidoreductase